MKQYYYIINENKGCVLAKKNKWMNIKAVTAGNKTSLRYFNTLVDAQSAMVSLPGHGCLSVYSTEKCWDVYGINLQNPGTEYKTAIQPKSAEAVNAAKKEQNIKDAPAKDVYRKGGEVDSNNVNMTLQTPFIMNSMQLLENLSVLREEWNDIAQEGLLELRKVDSALQDAMHLIELNEDLNEEESYNLMFNIRSLRIQRRRIKNELAVAEKMKEVFDPVSDQELGSAIMFVQNMKSRAYLPRSEYYDGLAKTINRELDQSLA